MLGYDFDEALTCNVCDRSFVTPRQLAHHQQKKRHFGCSACDSLFPSLMALEHHKEEFEHWSGDELSVGRASCDEDDDEDSLETVCSEELERLL
ncbi:Zinc finger protein 646 [Frankliniella fusca]|uniref:Zinc finger protein 646 n=1 Tax=Frankliniella fusca TaxID=407009 RepID=A0AAE1H7V4_9NEOP|nr:Zinc finger protein 646 [Frankliniella fusca]